MTDEPAQGNLLGLPANWVPPPVGRRGGRMSPAQREVIRLASRPEGVTASEAGRILHAHRNQGRGCGGAIRIDSATGEYTTACCPWMSSDGWDLLKRLKRRGIVHQTGGRGTPYKTGPAEGSP